MCTDKTYITVIIMLIISTLFFMGALVYEVKDYKDLESITSRCYDELTDQRTTENTKIEFYEFYPIGDDLWINTDLKLDMTLTSINWFNDTFGYSFTGDIVSYDYIRNVITIRVFDYEKVPETPSGGIYHTVSYQKLMRENVWTSTSDPDYMRYEWVLKVDGVLGGLITDDMIGIDYTVDMLWVKPLSNVTCDDCDQYRR